MLKKFVKRVNQMILKEKLLSENSTRVFDATELTFDEVRALLA